MIHRFCVCHRQPLIPDSWYDDCLPIGNFRPGSRCQVPQREPFWLGTGVAASRRLVLASGDCEAAHRLPSAIEQCAPSADLIELSSYRKRIFPSPEGRESPVFPTLRELTVTEAARRTDLVAFEPPNEFLMAWPLFFEDSLFEEYARNHRARDLLDYTSIAVELGFLDDYTSSEFLRSKICVPGGIFFGVFPRSFLLPAMSAIDSVGQAFLRRYGERLECYDDYQIRAISFLTERLGSYFLLGFLMQAFSISGSLADMPDRAARFIDGVPPGILGHMTVLTEGEASYSHGLVNEG